MNQRILLLFLLLASCRQSDIPFVPTNTGVEMRTCNVTTDCADQGICVAGLCQQVKSCQTDDECAADEQICHSSRFYCVECDSTHADECEPNYTCQFDFTCVMIENQPDAGTDTYSGSCTDRTECDPDNVCKNNTCCPPPARCFSVADCPVSSPQCNSATGECFGGASCFDDDDCNDQAGCDENACICDIPNTPPSSCRARPEECQTDADCRMNNMYVNKFCTISMPPKRCLDAPTCSSDTQCQNDNLVCDLTPNSESNDRCINEAPCTPNKNECNPATQTCVNNVYVAKNCINTPTLCMTDQTCDPNTDQCVQNSSCTMNPNYQPDFYCNTMVNPPMCELGCRDSTKCNGGVCNASHRCESTMNDLCSACTDDSMCPTSARCIDATSLCHEICSMISEQTCTDTARQCVFGNCTCMF